MSQLIVFPHCDMHVALNQPATRALPFRVFHQTLPGGSATYNLNDVTAACTYQVFAPYNPVGSRLTQFVTIDPAARTITGNQPGINLVVIQHNNRYIVVRIQVHDDVLGWWFGNSSITTALDAAVAHSQPSIYAHFSDDATGTDLVGDITGHGFVTLTSSSAGIFTVANANNEGRLQGVSEGTAQLNGSFLGINQSIDVNVVDYTKARNNLAIVRATDVANASEKHNILFLAEGFLPGDQSKFDRVVMEVTDSLFSQKRHEPYNTLEGGFNVFKAFQASKQDLVTCAFQVNDETAPSLATGVPIPYNHRVSTNDATYTVSELVARVGLPLRNEAATPSDLKSRWANQSLNLTATEKHYEPDRVDGTLIEVWRKSKSLGILEARDTFYGLMLGRRWADGVAGFGAAVTMPGTDSAADANLAPFIRRVYEWFSRDPTRLLTPDPRRHPPELHEYSSESRGALIMQYLGGLHLAAPPNSPIGTEWVPDGTFKRSRGLIAMIVNDAMIGGANFNAKTVTANSLRRNSKLDFEYAASNTATKKVMQRRLSGGIDPDLNDIINTVAHEFGHSFNLGDEYEEIRGDKPDAWDGFDNITSLNNVFSGPGSSPPSGSRLIDPGKLKWFELLRIELSAALMADSSQQGGEIEVTIDRRQIPRWVAAKAQGREAYLRRIRIAAAGTQLPLAVGDADYLVRLEIGDINESNGTIRLGGLELPPSPFPIFPKGSLLFVPRRDSGGNLVYVVEKQVRDFIAGNNLPLNKDTDTANVNKDPDYPKDIPNFKPPCKSARLIGVYEGAFQGTGLVYRPAGDCKMRSQSGGFCHVCKWLITNRVDPALHDVIDRLFFPEAKKNG
jgi:hypothetical protein